MKEVYIVKVKRDSNGNPRYAVDLRYYPECKNIGKAKKGDSGVRIFQSYNVQKRLEDCFNEKVEVRVLNY